MVSCKNQSEIFLPTETDAKFTSEEKDLSFIQGDVQNLVGVFLRASSFESGNSFDASDYDFSNADVAIALDKKDYYVATAVNKSKENEYVTFVSEDGLITSASKIIIGEIEENRIPFSYISILDNSVLFSGFLDTSANSVTLDYVDQALKLNSGLRASASGLLCNLAISGAGASWCYALGFISGGASVALGIAVTAAGYFICDGVE